MTIENQIKTAMAKAFFASAWADIQDESETGVNLSGKEIFDVMPDEIDPAALHAAETLIMGMEGLNPGIAVTITTLFYKLRDGCEGRGDREHTPGMFGHYAAMQAMGHGVGLDDAFGSKARELVLVPYIEFGSHSLEKDYS